MTAADDPKSYQEAISRKDAAEWKKAINVENDAHVKNDTFSVVSRDDSMNVINCMWIFTQKKDENGNVKRYKARLVAKGYSQVEGVDFNETFAPVMRYKSLRVILALSVLNRIAR